MYETREEALLDALKNERERRKAEEMVSLIRKIGATDTILRLAGAILMAPPEEKSA